MTCAGSRLLPEVARKTSGAFTCPTTHKVVIAGTKKRYRRRQEEQFKGKRPLVRRCPAGVFDQIAGSERVSRNTTASHATLPTLPSTRLRGAPATAAAARRSFAVDAKVKIGSRSTGAIPVLASVSSTAVAAHARTGIGTSRKKAAVAIAVSPTSEITGLEQIDSYSRGGGHHVVRGDRHLRKHRRGNRDGRGSGPVKIWCCPTTSSLREEACADLAGMAKPGLWRNYMHPPWERNDGHFELERLKERFKADRKRQAAGVKLKLDFLSVLRAEMSEDLRERWMQRRALMRADRFTVGQRRELREWFDCLDRDGSGEIDSSELSHPLLCTGLARSAVEVGHLVKQVDKDGSGEIGFKEFLAIFQPKGEPAAKNAIDKIVHLQEVKKAHGSDMESVVATERRSLLIREVLDEAAFRSSVAEEVAQQRYIAESNGDYAALKALREKEAKLERRRLKKNLFIQAVSDATDFKQERERLSDAALQETDRRRQIRENRAFAAGVGFLLPSRSSLKLSNTGGAAPMTVPFSEPEPSTTSTSGTRHSGGTILKVGVVRGGGGGEFNVRVSDTKASGSSAGADKRSEAHNLLAREENHLLQRRGHHHDFKRSASAKNLAGTSGVSGKASSLLRLGDADGSGRGGVDFDDARDTGSGDNAAASVAPATVTTSMRLYSTGGVVGSPSVAGGETSGVFASSVVAGGQEARRGLPPLPGGEAGTRIDREKPSVCSGSDSSPRSMRGDRGSRRSRNSSNPHSSLGSRCDIVPGESSAEEGDTPRADGSGGRGCPTVVDATCVRGHDSNMVAEAEEPEPSVPMPSAVGAPVAEGEHSTSAAALQASGRGRITPARVGSGVAADGRNGAMRSSRTDAGVDWYGHSKLRAVATGTPRGAMAASPGSGH